MNQNPVLRAAGYALIAGLGFASMGALVRLAESVNTPLAVFLRNAFGLIILLPWLLRPGLSGLGTTRPLAHLMRAGFGLAAMYCFFYTFRHLPLAQAMLLNYSAPLYLPIIAWLWLKEVPGPWVYPGIVIGLAGVGVLLGADVNGLWGLAGFVGLLSGILAAAAMACVRNLAATEPTTRIVFYFTLLAALLSGSSVPFTWQTPHWQGVALLAAAGGCATLAQISLTRAYALIPAAQVAPMTQFTVLFAALWGWLLWHESLHWNFYAGALLILLGSTLAQRGSRQPAAVADELLAQEMIDADLQHGRS